MEFVPLHGTVSTVKEDRGFGFIEVEGRSRDLYFKLHSLVHGLVPARGDRVKVFTRADRKGDEYVYRVELTQLASKRSRWREALRIMDDWRQKMQSDSTSQNALLEASSCLAVWRAVSELLTKAMHPQWDALAPEQPEATEKEEVKGADAMEVDATATPSTSRSVKRHELVFRKFAEEVMRQNEDLRPRLPSKRCQMSVGQVFFTHGEVSPQFRNGDTLTQLVSDLRRGRVLPSQDDRLRLEVFRLKQRVRSVNNRRLWVLKEFQKEHSESTVEVCVNIHPLCKGTAKFIADLCECTPVSSEVAAHPDTLAAQATLKDIAAERNCSNAPPWALEDRAELRSHVAVDELQFAGQRAGSVAQRKRRRELEDFELLAFFRIGAWLKAIVLGRRPWTWWSSKMACTSRIESLVKHYTLCNWSRKSASV
ncbi:unnamed protein product [Durusdinium trenchii]|uniref:CSD domain-containing protein n=1 Tax=Durusdinium trenchii TaxID=1381693 RepID=A0ABP0MNS5_9DINO